ncbi:MAG: hypothetical protein WEC12_04260 [Balneolaceae bacterium]
MKKRDKTAREMRNTLDAKRDKLEATYIELIDKLRAEKEQIEFDLKHEYRNARRYIRANPEYGVGMAFVSGLVIGVLLGKISQR